MMAVNNRLKWIVLPTVGIIGIYLAVCFALYRIPASGEPEYFEGRVIYKLEDHTGTNRQFFEERIMGNHIVRLEDDRVWYVSDSDYKVLWPRDPDEMLKQGRTIKTQLKAQKLLFGGYLMQEIRELDILNEAPTVIR
jgi:hypothetical protein